MTSLLLEGVTKSFGPVVAVDDVHLSVAQASITAVLGPSGCGKTTLLRMIAGFLEPDAGTIRFDDQEIGEVPPQEIVEMGISLSPEGRHVFPRMSVRENLDMGAYLRPRYGIYAVRARLLATGHLVNGAANLGIRPTFDPPKELLEPFLFDFVGDLYGQEIEVELRHFLRPEARFDDMPTLVAQMERDCLAAREALSAGPP